MEFKHPKYYKELRKRNKAARIPPTSSGQAVSDQAISLRAHDGECERSPGPGHKQQAASDSQVVNQVKLSSQSQATSFKRQAPEASSDKPQAPSHKRQA